MRKTLFLLFILLGSVFAESYYERYEKKRNGAIPIPSAIDKEYEYGYINVLAATWRSSIYKALKKDLLQEINALPLLTPKEEDWAREGIKRTKKIFKDGGKITKAQMESYGKDLFTIYIQTLNLHKTINILSKVISCHNKKDIKKESHHLTILLQNLHENHVKHKGYLDAKILFDRGIYSKKVFNNSKGIHWRISSLYDILFMIQ